jgi:hypothetical protein
LQLKCLKEKTMDTRVSAARKRVLTLLQSGVTLSSREASVRTFMSDSVARHIMLKLYRDEGLVFICGWVRDRDRGPWMARYSLKPGEDVVRPEPLTVAQKRRRFREQLKRNAAATGHSPKKHLRLEERLPARPDPLGLALFPWMYGETAKAIGVETATA